MNNNLLKIISSILIVIFLGLAGVYFHQVTSSVGILPFNFATIGLAGFLIILIPVANKKFKKFSHYYSFKHSQFFFKSILKLYIYLIIFISGLIFVVNLIWFLLFGTSFEVFFLSMFYTFLFYFGYLIGVYIGQKRITNRGEVHYYAVRLLVEIESDSIYLNIINDYNSFLKALDKWCMERLNSQIENIEKMLQKCVTELILNYEDTKSVIINFLNTYFFNQVEDTQSENPNLSNILQRIQRLVYPKINFEPKSLSKRWIYFFKSELFMVILTIIASIPAFISLFFV